MNNGLRRSPRLSQQYPQNTFTTLPASSSSSISTTSQPSPTTDPSCIASQHPLELGLQTQFLNLPFQSAAPLPSPSASGDNPFFGSSQTRSAFTMPEQGQGGGNTFSAQGQVSQGSLQNPQTLTTAQHHNSFSSNQRPTMTQTVQGQGQGPPPGFLAEAAKRAQMACLMRDLGDVTL